jgi:hypothetical protein
MKATFEADDQQETMRIVKSLDMANLIWYIHHNLGKSLKSRVDESLHEGIDVTIDEINNQIGIYGIVIDELTG